MAGEHGQRDSRIESHELRLMRFVIAGVFVAGLAACWVIPWRLGCGPEGSYYTFGYIGDEYLYAQRVQPFLPGTNAANPINGIRDPQFVSPFFLEDACRAVVTFSGMSVCTFIWVWRTAMPLVMAGLFVLLAGACLPRARYPWRKVLRYGMAAAAFPALYCLYDLVTPFPPLQGFAARFPTNIEYPVSMVLGVLYLRFLQLRDWKRAAGLALTGAALVYLRPYAAMPWAIAIGIAFLVLLVRRQIPLRTVLLAAALLLVALVPWFVVNVSNSRLPVYKELVARYFRGDSYAVHDKWFFFCGTGVAFLVGARLVSRRYRILAWSCGLTMLVLPFVCGRLVFARELRYDRFGVFYLVALLMLGMLVLARRSVAWRRRGGALEAARWLTVAGVCAAGGLAAENTYADFAQYPMGPYAFVAVDHKYLPAYEWVRGNTPPDALVAVDDGIDWTMLKGEGMPFFWPAMADVFAVVAQRRPLFMNRLYTCALSDADEKSLKTIHMGTFHGKADKAEYLAALQRFRPDYIFWRKEAPLPRGYGPLLRSESEVVYADEVCEIWKLHAPDEGRRR